MLGIKHTTVDGMRLHLRRDGKNLLWINSLHLLVLNDTAAEYVENYIDQMNFYTQRESQGSAESDRKVEAMVLEMVPTTISLRYNISKDIAVRDFHKIIGSIADIAHGKCPINDLGFGFEDMEVRKWSAPSRMDLALTYQCNNNCYFCYMGGPKKTEELSQRQWYSVLDKLWEAGIPQVVFTGGEPTVRKDLGSIVDYAQQFVTGLVTNGRRLDKVLCRELKKSSLDYVQVTIESSDSTIHDQMTKTSGSWMETQRGIITALESGLQVVTNTTLMRDNYSGDNIRLLMNFLKNIGIKTMSFNSLICSGRGSNCKGNSDLSNEELKVALEAVLNAAEVNSMEVQWYTPTCYKKLNPMELGFGVKSCSAAKFNMTIEPNGRVIPCQSWIHEDCGNIMTDDWKTIWNSEVAQKARDSHAGEECHGCEFIFSCEGSCPLDRENK